MEEAAADETSVPEEPEPVPEETAYPVCIHVATEDGEELLSTLDSDEELDLIYNQFMERLFADEEMED